VKKILLILALTCTSLWAQVPPPPGVPSPVAPTRSLQPSAPAANPAAEPGLIAIAPMNKFNLTEADLNHVYGKDEINFKEVSINEFLQVYAETVNRTILRPGTLPAPTITLRNQTPITRREAIMLLDAVLGINGIAMIPVGEKFVKAVPIGEASAAGGSLEHGEAKDIPELGPYITHVVQLKYTKPSEMIPIIQPFAKIPNSILPIEGNGILVIRDFSENVKRMLEMIAQVDVSVPAEFISEVIQIKYALASDMASALNTLGGGGGGGSIGSSGGGAARPTGARTGSRGGGLGGGLGVQGNQNYPGGVGTQGGIGTQGTQSTFTDRLKSIINKASTPAAASGSGDIQIFGQTKIIADERMNALLVYATRQDMEIIKDIISKLDVVLAQVLIESVILGVSGNRNLELGVSASQSQKNLGKNVDGAGVINNSPDQFSQWLSGASNAIPVVGGLAYYGKIDQNWDVAIKAVAGDGKTEVLQKPRIMTTHAKPGHFFVGDTVPYVTSTYYGGGYGGGPSSSYQQLRVGIDITVTPFINPDGLVLMQIDQQIEQLGDTVTITGVGEVPKTTSRSLSSEIAVRDKETILLGGFISANVIKSKSGVPLLKDIPVMGALFRSSTSKKDRAELMVLMRPTVMKTPELAAIHTAEEQAKSPGISRFERSLKKEQEDFERQMDKLDGVKLRKPPVDSTEPSPTIEYQPAPAGSSKPLIAPAETTPAKLPEHEPAPSKPLLPPAETPPPVTPEQQPSPENQPVDPEWTKPTSQKTTKPAADPFKSVQPMTEEEKRAFGRIPE